MPALEQDRYFDAISILSSVRANMYLQKVLELVKRICRGAVARRIEGDVRDWELHLSICAVW